MQSRHWHQKNKFHSWSWNSLGLGVTRWLPAQEFQHGRSYKENLDCTSHLSPLIKYGNRNKGILQSNLAKLGRSVSFLEEWLSQSPMPIKSLWMRAKSWIGSHMLDSHLWTQWFQMIWSWCPKSPITHVSELLLWQRGESTEGIRHRSAATIPEA